MRNGIQNFPLNEIKRRFALKRIELFGNSFFDSLRRKQKHFGQTFGLKKTLIALVHS